MALVLLLTLLNGRTEAMILFILVLNVMRSNPVIPVFLSILLIVRIMLMNKHLPQNLPPAIPSREVAPSRFYALGVLAVCDLFSRTFCC